MAGVSVCGVFRFSLGTAWTFEKRRAFFMAGVSLKRCPKAVLRQIAHQIGRFRAALLPNPVESVFADFWCEDSCVWLSRAGFPSCVVCSVGWCCG